VQSLRSALCFAAMQSFGIRLHDARNQAATGGRADIISAPGSQIKVFVVPTDEERCIAEQVTFAKCMPEQPLYNGQHAHMRSNSLLTVISGIDS
jgi:Acetokinase family